MIDRGLERRPRDILVSKRPDGKRPGYGRWDDPGMSPGTSSSGGSRNGGGGGPPGGGDRQMTYSAPSPDRQDRARQQAAIEQAAPAKAPEPKDEPIIRHHTVYTTIQKLEQKILDQLQEKEKEKFDADWEFEDKKVVKIPDIKPKIVETPERGVPWLEDKLVKTVTPQKISPTYYQDRSRIGGETWGERAEAGMKRGFWDSGLGTLLKGAGAAVALPFASAFLPKDMMTALTWAKRAKDIKEGKGILGWGAKKLGINRSTLTSTIDKARGRQFDPQDPIGWTGEQKRTKTFHKDKGDKQQETTIQETIAGEKPLGIDFEDLRKKQFIMKNALDEGYYTDNKGRRIQLTDKHKKMLTNYITQIDQYLVDPTAMAAYGGRIDKALGGRSRDIG